MNFTQLMMMHLNGGSKFSQLNFEVYADGKPCGIQRITRTAGSPDYLKTVDQMKAANGDIFDVLATRGVGMEQWLIEHVVTASPSEQGQEEL